MGLKGRDEKYRSLRWFTVCVDVVSLEGILSYFYSTGLRRLVDAVVRKVVCLLYSFAAALKGG